jgi:hypothetical protein
MINDIFSPAVLILLNGLGMSGISMFQLNPHHSLLNLNNIVINYRISIILRLYIIRLDNSLSRIANSNLLKAQIHKNSHKIVK